MVSSYPATVWEQHTPKFIRVSAAIMFRWRLYSEAPRAQEFQELASPPRELEQKLELGSESKLKGSRE